MSAREDILRWIEGARDSVVLHWSGRTAHEMVVGARTILAHQADGLTLHETMAIAVQAAGLLLASVERAQLHLFLKEKGMERSPGSGQGTQDVGPPIR